MGWLMPQNDAYDHFTKSLACEVEEGTDKLNKVVRVEVKVPSNCKDCAFRMNESRGSWKCFVVKNDRGTYRYIPGWCDAEKERARFCPFNNNSEN